MTPTTIYLHGYLGEKYGTEPIVLYVDSLRDALRGLTSKFGRGFMNDIRANKWNFTLNPIENDSLEGNEEITNQFTDFPLPAKNLHIYPYITGEGWIAGIITALATSLSTSGVGVALGISVATAQQIIVSVIVLAVSAAINAISAAINKPEISYEQAEVDRKASFLYNGVVNVIEQGGPVPLVYGEHLVGSTVISAAIVSDQLGDRINLLDEEDTNLWNPLLGGWVGVGATVEKIDGKIVITKTTAAGIAGGAELPFDLPPDRYFFIRIAYEAWTTGVNQVADTFAINGYDSIKVEVKDDANITAETIAKPTQIDNYVATPGQSMKRQTVELRFRTQTIQGYTRVVISPVDSEATGTIRKLTSVAITTESGLELGQWGL